MFVFGCRLNQLWNGANNMGILDRLKALEAKLNPPLTPLIVVYLAEHGLSDEQQAQIEAAEAVGQEVKEIRIVSPAPRID